MFVSLVMVFPSSFLPSLFFFVLIDSHAYQSGFNSLCIKNSKISVNFWFSWLHLLCAGITGIYITVLSSCDFENRIQNSLHARQTLYCVNHTPAFFLAVFSTHLLSLLLLHWDGLLEQYGWNEMSSQCGYLISWQKEWKVSNLNFPMPESWQSHCLDAKSADIRADSLPHSSAYLISSYTLSSQEGIVAVNTLDSSYH